MRLLCPVRQNGSYLAYSSCSSVNSNRRIPGSPGDGKDRREASILHNNSEFSQVPAHQVWNYVLDPTLFMTLRQGKTIGPACVPGIFTNSQIGAWYSEEGVDLLPRSPGAPPPTPLPMNHQSNP